MNGKRKINKSTNITIKSLISYIIIAVIIVVLIFTSIYFFKGKNNRKVNGENYYKEIQYSCDIDITRDKDTIKPGELVTYNIHVKNIKAKNGIIMFETLIDYDKDVFECEVKGGIDEDWNMVSMVDNYLTMMRNDLMPNSADQIVANIKFKVKDDASKGIKTIKFSKLKFTMDNDEYFNKDDKSIDIKVVENE